MEERERRERKRKRQEQLLTASLRLNALVEVTVERGGVFDQQPWNEVVDDDLHECIDTFERMLGIDAGRPGVAFADGELETASFPV